MGSIPLALKRQANQIPPFQGGPHRSYPRVETKVTGNPRPVTR